MKLPLCYLIAAALTLLKSDELALKPLEILHFNDAYDIEKSATFVHEWLARDGPATLRLFSGDIYSPSTVSLFQQGRQFAPLIKRLNLHAAVIGNHEFDFGEEHFLRLKGLNPELDWLNANLRVLDSKGTLFGDTRASKVVTLNGVKVGVFGLVDEDWLDASGVTPDRVQLLSPVSTARRVSRQLRKKGCDYVIALTHMANKSDRLLLEDGESDIDLVLGGHDHIYYVETRNGRLLLKSGCDFGHFSRLRLSLSEKPLRKRTATGDFDFLLDERVNGGEFSDFSFSFKRKQGGLWLNVQIERVSVSPEGPRDPAISTYLQDSIRPLTNSFSRPIFYLESRLEARGQVIRRQESAICNFVTDLVRIETQADVAVLTSGAFRLERSVKEGTFLRYIDAIHLLPFYEEIEVFWFTGAEVLELLEDGVRAMLSGGSLMSVSGVAASFDAERPEGHKVMPETVTVGQRPLDPTRIYKVATTVYLGSGKSGFNVFARHQGRKEVRSATSPLRCLKDVWELANSHDFRQEFEVYKRHLSAFGLAQLETVQEALDYKKMYYTLHESLLESHSPEALVSRLSPSVLKRLMVYSLFAGTVAVEGIAVFAVDFREPEHRIRPAMIEEL